MQRRRERKDQLRTTAFRSAIMFSINSAFCFAVQFAWITISQYFGIWALAFLRFRGVRLLTLMCSQLIHICTGKEKLQRQCGTLPWTLIPHKHIRTLTSWARDSLCCSSFTFVSSFILWYALCVHLTFMLRAQCARYAETYELLEILVLPAYMSACI